MSKYVKCPICDLNYIIEGDDMCLACREKLSAKPKTLPNTEAYDKLMKRLADRGLTNGYMPWGGEEDSALRDEFRRGLSIKQMSEIHKRTTGAIKSRLRKLNLID